MNGLRARLSPPLVRCGGKGDALTRRSGAASPSLSPPGNPAHPLKEWLGETWALARLAGGARTLLGPQFHHASTSRPPLTHRMAAPTTLPCASICSPTPFASPLARCALQLQEARRATTRALCYLHHGRRDPRYAGDGNHSRLATPYTWEVHARDNGAAATLWPTLAPRGPARQAVTTRTSIQAG